MSNYAFIDAQNLYVGIKQLGWTLDTKKFRDYIGRKYRVTKAYYFIGYMPRNASLYHRLAAEGYELRFKPVVPDASGMPKGNVDADLVLQAMIDVGRYDGAVLVSGDGDYYSLVQYLSAQGKLTAVLSPNRQFCSALLKRSGRGKISYISDIRHIVEL